MSETTKPKFTDKLKKIKHIELIIAVIAISIMLLLYFSSKAFGGSEETQQGEQNGYCERMESRLTDTLSAMKGVGKTKLVVNWESSVESIIAYITSTNGNSSTKTPQLVNTSGSSKPLVLKEVYPKAIGVIIVCEGGDSIATKVMVKNAVSMLLNVSPDKISVHGMK